MAIENDPPATEVEKISLDDVLRSGPFSAAQEAPPLPRIGFKPATFLWLCLSVVKAVQQIEFLYNAAMLPGSGTLDSAQLASNRQFSEIAADRTIKPLDPLVLKGFLPVLPAVLGYNFGPRGAEGGEG